MFEFNKLEDLQIFIKHYIFYFTDDPGPGALLFLYSAVWTRGFENVRTDLDATKGAHLMGNYEEGSLNIVTLLLSGRATPYLHNGVSQRQQSFTSRSIELLFNHLFSGCLCW